MSFWSRWDTQKGMAKVTRRYTLDKSGPLAYIISFFELFNRINCGIIAFIYML